MDLYQHKYFSFVFVVRFSSTFLLSLSVPLHFYWHSDTMLSAYNTSYPYQIARRVCRLLCRADH